MHNIFVERAKRGSMRAIYKRIGSSSWNRSPLVLFTVCLVVLGSLTPLFGPGGLALAIDEDSVTRAGYYDFNMELSGLVPVNCNLKSESGSGSTFVSSIPTDGSLNINLRTDGELPSNSSLIDELKAEAEGSAGVGIRYIAPKSGRIKIEADVVVTGNAKLKKVVPPIAIIVEASEALSARFGKPIDFGPAGELAETVWDKLTGGFVQSWVGIQGYRSSSPQVAENYLVFVDNREPLLNIDGSEPLQITPPIFKEATFNSWLVRDSHDLPPSLEMDVIAGEKVSLCVGIKSKVQAITPDPFFVFASVDYYSGTRVESIMITYLSTSATQSSNSTTSTSSTTSSSAQSCGQEWAVGQRVMLKQGAEIRQGNGTNYAIHTVVPVDNWPVDVIDGPRCVDGSDWWDISRANIDGGGTGWVNRSQAAFVVGTSTPSSGTYSGPEPPQYAPSFAGQTVSWNGNSFRSDNGTTWIFQGSDAERAQAESEQKARELAEAEAMAQGSGVYLQKANLLELFNDINKNASDFGLADAEYVIIRGPYKATIYSWYRGEGDVIAIYSGEGTYKLPAVRVGSVRAEVILPPEPEPLPEIPVPPISPPPTSPVTPSAPSPGPSPKIVFTSDRGNGNLQIYSMDVDGSNQVNLSQNSADDYSPSRSPDGTKIAFTSNRDGNYRVYVMNADGTGQVALTGSGSHNREAAWSPDGTKIAFNSTRDGNDEIYVMNADGSNPVRLTFNYDIVDYLPSWSPDGTKIAFLSDRDGNDEIYSMNANGTSQTRITNTPFSESKAAWSPDGSKIAFTSRRDGHNEIYSMNADGSNPARLTNSSASSWPSWIANGAIIFATNRDGNDEIYSMDANGANQTNLTNNSFTDMRPN